MVGYLLSPYIVVGQEFHVMEEIYKQLAKIKEGLVELRGYL